MYEQEDLLWLEYVADLFFNQWSRPKSRFYSSCHEDYLDAGSFGTGVIYNWWEPGSRQLRYKALPLSECFFDENENDEVDTLSREFKWSARQMKATFGDLPDNVERGSQKNQFNVKKWTIVHMVIPRTDRSVTSKTNRNMPWGSYYYVRETKEMLSESGFKTFPYMVNRWTKISNEPYGRSPAMKCLPDIKVLNRFEYLNLKIMSKYADPPIAIPNEGYLLPFRTGPGAVNFKEPETEEPFVFQYQGTMQMNEQKLEQKRAYIKECFFVDFARLEKENLEMTAYEVQDRRDEKMRLSLPQLYRTEDELLDPLIKRGFQLMSAAGMITQAPPNIRGRKLKIVYSNQASQAQMGSKAQAIMMFLQELTPWAQVDPTVLQRVRSEEVPRLLARLRNVSQTIIRSDQEVEEIQQQAAMQQQLEQIANVSEPVSNAVKNFADANNR
jgi:hypothetical protein